MALVCVDNLAETGTFLATCVPILGIRDGQFSRGVGMQIDVPAFQLLTRLHGISIREAQCYSARLVDQHCRK